MLLQQIYNIYHVVNIKYNVNIIKYNVKVHYHAFCSSFHLMTGYTCQLAASDFIMVLPFLSRKTEDFDHSKCHHELPALQEAEDDPDPGEADQICK